MTDPAHPTDHRPHPWDVGLTAVLTAVALAARVWTTSHGLDGDALPVGPDGEDWLLGTRALLEEGPGLDPHRYPLLPWLVAGVIRSTGADPLRVLQVASLAASAGLAPLTFLIGRAFLPRGLAVAAATAVALGAALVIPAAHPTAYAPFALAFATVAYALLGRVGRPAGWILAACGAFWATASMNQGLLCLLALAPAGLCTRRPGTMFAASCGAGLGLACVYGLHPGARSPVSWMAAEAWRYLAGNVAEETGTRTFAEAFSAWSPGALSVPGGLAVAVLLLALVGLAAAGMGIPGPARALERRLSMRLPDAPSPRGAAAGLALALVPLAVLVARLASPHHLLHLAPLLVAAVALGIRWLLPGASHPAAGAVLAAIVGILGVHGWDPAQDGLRAQAAGARAQRVLGEALVAAVGPGGLVITDPPSPATGGVDPLWQSLWAVPRTLDLFVAEDRPGNLGETRIRDAARTGRTVAWVGADAPCWAMGSARIEPVDGTSTPLPWSAAPLRIRRVTLAPGDAGACRRAADAVRTGVDPAGSPPRPPPVGP